jgi:hypothetical protein
MRKTIITVVLLMLAMACTGVSARDTVLLKSIRMSWQSSIIDMVEYGGGDSAPMSEALNSGEPSKIETHFRQAVGMAITGVGKMLLDKKIGPNVKVILLEEINHFNSSIVVFLQRRTSYIMFRPNNHTQRKAYFNRVNYGTRRNR